MKKAKVGNRYFFDGKKNSHEGNLYTREIYEEEGYMRAAIDRDDGKGQIMIETTREHYEFEVIETYFSQLLEKKLEPATRLPHLYKYLTWLMKKQQEEKQEKEKK